MSTSARRRSTVHDVARVAGVSRGTVSRVINGGYVSDSARTAIEDAIREVGYVPNTAAQNLVRCLLYTSPSPRDKRQSRMPSSA